MDLFTTKISTNKLNPQFKEIYKNNEYEKVREVIQSWGNGLLSRSGEQRKFINEFQTTFNSAFWELFLNQTLIRLGYSVDYTKDSPDFCVTTPNGYQFNVEAVISDRPHIPSKNDIFSESKFLHQSTLKLLGKINDKRDLFTGIKGKKNPYSSLEHVKGKPFVLALAPFDSNLSLTQNNTIINRVLFGIEQPSLADLKSGHQKKIRTIQKNGNVEIPLGLFTNDSYKEISAILFSTTGTFGKAIIQSGISRYVRATRFRAMNVTDFITIEGAKNEGIHCHKIGPLQYLRTQRFPYGQEIVGCDNLVFHTEFYHETHFDGLHVYYNPFADIPFDAETFFPPEITHNFYDINTEESIQNHPDGALVSRQVFAPTKPNLRNLIRQWCPDYANDI